MKKFHYLVGSIVSLATTLAVGSVANAKYPAEAESLQATLPSTGSSSSPMLLTGAIVVGVGVIAAGLRKFTSR